MKPRIGSLFSGGGFLDLAVLQVFCGDIVWHSQYEPPDKDGKEKRQFAAEVLDYRWPGVPNLGDINLIDFANVEPVDIVCGGFPCTDISNAGKRAGIEGGPAGSARGSGGDDLRGDDEYPTIIEICPDDPGRVHTSWGYCTTADAYSELVRKQSVGQRGGGGASVTGRDREGSVADSASDRRREGRTESEGFERGSDAAVCGHAATDTDGIAGAGSAGDRTAVSGQPQPAVDWGRYGPAIRRWESVLGRPAPSPWQISDRTGNRQLSARFTEWMMGLPDGWVTDVPGMTRNGALHVLGNGVVPQQAVYALGLLLQRSALAVAS